MANRHLKNPGELGLCGRAGDADRREMGFTLIEMIVVIGIIVLVAGISLPSISALMTAGSDAQAHNVLAGQLVAARSVAMQRGTHAGVHVGMAAESTGLTNACYTAVVWDNPDPAVPGNDFTLAPGYSPQRISGTMAFGEIRSDFIDSEVDGGKYHDLDSLENWTDFTTFTIVFSPRGQVVKQINKLPITFDASSPLFTDTGTDETRIWDPPLEEDGATAVTLFDYAVLNAISIPLKRAELLDSSGQLLPVNIYTGELFPRQ